MSSGNIPDFSDSGIVLRLEPLQNHEGWFRGPEMHPEECRKILSQLKRARDFPCYRVLVGAVGGETKRIYVTPLITVGKLVRFFRVGARGAESFGQRVESLIEEVAGRIELVHRICAFTVSFADEAGMHAEFDQTVRNEEAAKIEALFPIERALELGLGEYLASWSGTGPFLSERLLLDRAIYLWWD